MQLRTGAYLVETLGQIFLVKRFQSEIQALNYDLKVSQIEFHL